MFTPCYWVSVLTWKYETSAAPEADTSVTTDNDFKSLDKHSARQVPTICKTAEPPVCSLSLPHGTCLDTGRGGPQRAPEQTLVAWALPCTCSPPTKVCLRLAARARKGTDTRMHTDPHQGSPVTGGRTNIFHSVCSIFYRPGKSKMIKLWRGKKAMEKTETGQPWQPVLGRGEFRMTCLTPLPRTVALACHNASRLNHNQVYPINLSVRKKNSTMSMNSSRSPHTS